jgi:ribosomal protein S18 acetylase RimI-like enzyme
VAVTGETSSGKNDPAGSASDALSASLRFDAVLHRARPEDLWVGLKKVVTAPRVFLGVPLDRLADHLRQAEVIVLNHGVGGYGLLSVQVRPFRVAVITAAVVEPQQRAAAYLRLLLNEIGDVLREQGVESLAQVGYAPWVEDILRSSGFVSREKVVTFEWNAQSVAVQGNRDVQVTPARVEDLPNLLQMDRSLFGPVWHKGPLEFSTSLARSHLFTIARLGDRIVGYQWCDRFGDRAHLTRLAVEEPVQHQGIGTRLLTEALAQLAADGVRLVTLNTQTSNSSAQRLYQLHGFRALEEEVDLWWKDL